MTHFTTYSSTSQQQETAILSQIVDALISVQDELDGARPAEWDSLLREACRQQKWSEDAILGDELEPCGSF